MRFLTVDSFVKRILETSPKAADIYVNYIVEDAREDLYGKLTVYPMLLVVAFEGSKIVVPYKEIIDIFEDTIGLTLSKPKIECSGIACCKISTKPEHSEKFDSDFYPRKYILVTENVVNTVNDIKKNIVEKAAPEVLDI